MAIEYRLDTARGLTVVVWDGNISDAEVTGYLIRLAEDLEWPPGPVHLTDLTTAGKVDVTDPDLVAELVAGNPETARLAILARDGHAVARRLGKVDAPPDTTVAVFHDLRTACVWLDIDPAPTQVILDAIRRDLR